MKVQAIGKFEVCHSIFVITTFIGVVFAQAGRAAANDGWSALPGEGTTKLSDAAVVYGDRISLFAIGIDDGRHYMNRFDGHGWNGWSEVPGGSAGAALADTAVVFKDRLYLFGVGTDNHLHYLNTFDGKKWSGWTALPGAGTTRLSDAAVVYQDRIFLFAIGIDNGRHYMNTFDAHGWSGLSEVPGGSAGAALPDTAVVFKDRLHLFGVGTNDHLHYMNTFDGRKWSGWGAVPFTPGGGKSGIWDSKSALSDTAAVHDGTLDLFAVGLDDGRHHVNRFDGQNWSGWMDVPGGSAGAKVADSAVVYQGNLHLFGVGTNDHRHYVNVLHQLPKKAPPALEG